MSQGVLPGLHWPYGVFEAFVAMGPVTLVLKEKILSLRDSYDLWLLSGNPNSPVEIPLFHIQGVFATMHHRKHIYLHRDAPREFHEKGVKPGMETTEEGHVHLCDVIQKFWAPLHPTFYVVPPNADVAKEEGAGETYVSIRSKWLRIFGDKATVTFQGPTLAPPRADGSPREIIIEAGAFDRSTEVYEKQPQDDKDKSVMLAMGHRKIFNFRNILASADSYYIDVAPGADILLIAALFLAQDEKRKERERENAAAASSSG